MGANIKEQEEIFRMAQCRGSSRNKKIKLERRKTKYAYEAIRRHGVISGHEMVSPGKCKMPLSLVTFNITQDNKR